MGDIAGMGADLFGSFAESTCAALVISSSTLFASNGQQWDHTMYLQNLMFPLVLTAIGIYVSVITSAVGIYINNVNEESKIESTLKYQIIISTVLLLGFLYLGAYLSFPKHFVLIDISYSKTYQAYHAYLCAMFGLVSGMLIGGFTEYMTSHTSAPFRELAGS